MSDPILLPLPIHPWRPHMPWMEQASCAQTHEPDTWFPLPSDTGGRVQTAKRICARCPVRTDCLEYAMTGADRSWPGQDGEGVWGGLTAPERAVLALQRRERTAA